MSFIHARSIAYGGTTSSRKPVECDTYFAMVEKRLGPEESVDEDIYNDWRWMDDHLHFTVVRRAAWDDLSSEEQRMP